jgi:hypothetical protein
VTRDSSTVLSAEVRRRCLRPIADLTLVIAVFQNKAMKCKLHLKVVNADKALMIQHTNAHMQHRASQGPATDAPTEAVPIPSPRELEPDEQWVTITSGDAKPMDARELEKARWSAGDGIWYI